MPLRRILAVIAAPLIVGFSFGPAPASASTGPLQQTQLNSTYAGSFAKLFDKNQVFNTLATTKQTSCYTPEVPYTFNGYAPREGYSGMSACPDGAPNTGENAVGPYPTQAGSNPGYPAPTAMLVKNHAESNMAVDPTNAQHLIGSSKWFAGPEGYNHVLGFYESWDGGQTWPVQGHIPGYEGWTDNTDPVGAFDSHGNFYEFILAYQFFYGSGGSHNFATNPNQEPNPTLPAEIVGVSVHNESPGPSSTSATAWSTTVGTPDIIAAYDNIGHEPDKQWIAIDTKTDTIYAMWVVFKFFTPVPYFSTAQANADGTHTAWSTPQKLPAPTNSDSDTYLLPNVAPDGTVYVALNNFPAAKSFSTTTTYIDYSINHGASWVGPIQVTPTANTILAPFCCYQNTNTRSGITDTFAIGPNPSKAGIYPLYVAWEDYSTGFANLFITASYDGGSTWPQKIKINDNQAANVDEFQPNLAVVGSGTVAVAFYDRRLACPAAGSNEAAVAGLSLDNDNPYSGGSLPPYSANNYCANTSIQFYGPNLASIGQNIRLSQYSFDPELNSDLYASWSALGRGFIGDYFGAVGAGSTFVTTSVTTIDDGFNSSHRQQQLVAVIAAPSP